MAEKDEVSPKSKLSIMKKRLDRLERSPSQEIGLLAGPFSKRVWSRVKKVDLIAPQKPNLRTCFCGTTVLVLVFLLLIHTIVTKHVASEPNVIIAHDHPVPGDHAPLPDVALAVCDNAPIEVITVPMFLKYVTPKFTYRTVSEGFTQGRVKTDLQMDWRNGKACGLPETMGQTCIIFCAGLGVPSYLAQVTRSVAGKKTKYMETVANNLTLQGKYGDPHWSWLEITLDLVAKDLSTVKSMDTEFWRDSHGNTRRQSFNLFFRFKHESWNKAHGIVYGDWSWFLYNRIPRNISTADTSYSPSTLQYKVDLTINTAQIGMLHPPADGFLNKEPQTISWFGWEGYHEFASNDLPYMASDSSSTLMEVDVQVGNQARKLTVTYPALAEALFDVGASYEFAKGVGITFAFIVWLICQCNLADSVKALCNASQEEFAESAGGHHDQAASEKDRQEAK